MVSRPVRLSRARRSCSGSTFGRLLRASHAIPARVTLTAQKEIVYQRRWVMKKGRVLNLRYYLPADLENIGDFTDFALRTAANFNLDCPEVLLPRVLDFPP